MGPVTIKVLTLAAALAVLGGTVAAGAVTEAEMAKMHAAAVARDRPIVYNTDGCDMLYYPNGREVSPKAFCDMRLQYAVGSRISTVSYCPLASGFGYFTLLKAGDPLTNTVDATSHNHNGTLEFAAIGHDCLEMALDFSRRNGFERFMSIRMNDSHDGSTRPGEGKIHPLFSAFRRRHPEYLMGNPDKGEWPVVCRWQWTCVNFGEPEVRDFVRTFMRQFCENYDMEGIEMDFCRHLNYFRSVAWGGTASNTERRQMSDLVRDIRAITREFELKKGHPILLTARVPDSPDFCRDIGLDIDAWLKERSVDALICGCYFNLNDPQVMADYIHARGVKCYASIDESRIPGSAAHNKLPLIEGRDTIENYRARYAAAMSAGCDGVYLFNLEGGRLNEYCKVDPRELDGYDKVYFATERGTGGYTPTHYLKDGFRHMKLPRVDPAAPAETHPHIVAHPYGLNLRIGDDFAKAAARGLAPVITVMALVDRADEETVDVALGGRKLPVLGFEKGLATYRADPSLVKRGVNVFEVSARPQKSANLLDFAVRIVYEPTSGKDPKPALRPAAFDSRLNAFVWRNWGLLPADRMAKAVGTDVDRLTKMAEEFGLASLPPSEPDWREKGLITILRRNWHLLAYPQLCTLLGLTSMELATRLAGDDFVRLGQVKPQCEPLVYTDGEAEAGLAERKRFVVVMERTKCDPAALSEPRFQFDPDLRIDFPYVPALDGAEQTPKVQAAREALSEGLREYASLGAGASCGPQRMGPANPLYAKPTGWSAAAGGLPYDDLKRWASPSSPAVWIDRMRKVEQCFVRGCKLLAQAVAEMDDEDVRTAAKRELDFLKAEALHIHSAANQAEFVIARDRGQKDLANWLADDEVTTARRLFPLVSADSRIGYESANGYFYLPRDLIEKIVSCLRTKARQ